MMYLQIHNVYISITQTIIFETRCNEGCHGHIIVYTIPISQDIDTYMLLLRRRYLYLLYIPFIIKYEASKDVIRL